MGPESDYKHQILELHVPPINNVRFPIKEKLKGTALLHMSNGKYYNWDKLVHIQNLFGKRDVNPV